MTGSLGVALLLAAGTAWAEHPGYVDSSALVKLAGGDDAVRVEINLPGRILRTFSGFDRDLYDLVKDVDSLTAVILELPSTDLHEKAKSLIRDEGARLKKKGWDRIAVVREEDSEVQVMLLVQDEVIQGLVVMVVDFDSGELIFVNLAGTVDLEKIQMLGEQYDVPGLEHVRPEN